MTTTPAVPPGRTAQLPRSVVPYLAVGNGAQALDFYARAFGAVEVMRMEDDDFGIAHSEFTIGGATFYLSDEWVPMNVRSPKSLGGYSVSLAIEIADVDPFVEHLTRHGVTVERAVEDGPGEGQRHAWVVDPYGHRWHIQSPAEAAGRTGQGGPA